MSTARKLPLLDTTALDAPIACWQHRIIRRAEFLCHVTGVASALPRARFILNLCENRYRFMVAFAAVGLNGQTNLLPASRAPVPLRQLAEDYPDSAQVTDADLEPWLAATATDNIGLPIPELPGDQLMAIAFTSGSTGRAKPNPKRWSELLSGAHQAQQRFGLTAGLTVVATVPPQHMYGLETSIMAPLASGVCVHAGRPFFPEDVRTALQEAAPRRVLITTPVHLQACLRADLRWPELAWIVSATAPLSVDLAAHAEQVFNAPVLEIYGCTEAGSIASRRPLHNELWQLYAGFRLEESRLLAGAHLAEPVPLNDRIETCGAEEFRLLGRCEDLINMAGKRSSLAWLNHQLNQIDGVVEGVFIVPDNSDEGTGRLTAVVVAPDLSERQLWAALAERLDPVFLPRPLLKVEALPRNETGKLTRDALLALLRPGSDPVGQADAR